MYIKLNLGVDLFPYENKYNTFVIFELRRVCVFLSQNWNKCLLGYVNKYLQNKDGADNLKKIVSDKYSAVKFSATYISFIFITGEGQYSVLFSNNSSWQ